MNVTTAVGAVRVRRVAAAASSMRAGHGVRGSSSIRGTCRERLPGGAGRIDESRSVEVIAFVQVSFIRRVERSQTRTSANGMRRIR